MAGLLIGLFLQPTNAFASECPNGCYLYYDAEQQKNIQIPFLKEDQEAYSAWYQSIVGIPVWNPPFMADGSTPTPPAGPWITQDMLPKQPIPYKSIEAYKNTNNTNKKNNEINLAKTVEKPNVNTNAQLVNQQYLIDQLKIIMYDLLKQKEIKTVANTELFTPIILQQEAEIVALKEATSKLLKKIKKKARK